MAWRRHPERPAPPGAWRATLFSGLLLLAVGDAAGDEREDVEARLAEIQADIEALQNTLEERRSTRSRELAALRALDLEIQRTARTLAEVADDLAAQQAEVDRLRAEQNAYLEQLSERESELARQVLAAWKLSRQSRLELIFNQDDPARLGRMLAYYDYLGEAQADRIRALRDVLHRLEGMRLELDRELETLGDIQAEHEQRRVALQDQREDRLALVARLEREMGSDQERIAELQRNRQDLETLLERLGDALSDIPADLGNRRHPSEMRGELPMPLAGRVLQAFGQPRSAGMVWQGWLIEAGAGQDVRSVAYGRVAYADWLRGYGLLLILDHGDGFMSLYGHNESLRAEVGDWVEPGEVISTVGRSPERRQGLYFELRRAGEALDPAAWVRR